MNKKFSKITDLLALTVFSVFAVCVLLVLLYGARVYGNLTQRGEESFRRRTAVQYVTTRVRQAQTVTVSDFEGYPALTMCEEIDGQDYVTRVYCCEGFLRELFCAQTAAVAPEDGEKIMAAEEMRFSIEDGLLTATIGRHQVVLQLLGKEGGTP